MLGGRGLWPGASALAGRRRPQAMWLATQAPAGPRAGRPWTRPLPPAEVLGPELVHQGLWHFAPPRLMFCHRLSGFSTTTCSYVVSPLSSVDWRTTLTWALSAPYGEASATLPASPARTMGWALGWVQGVPQLTPRAPNAFCIPLSGALGQWLGLTPTWVLGQAKANQLVTMQRLPRESPRAARWALTGPPSPSPAGCNP